MGLDSREGRRAKEGRETHMNVLKDEHVGVVGL